MEETGPRAMRTSIIFSEMRRWTKLISRLKDFGMQDRYRVYIDERVSRSLIHRGGER